VTSRNSSLAALAALTALAGALRFATLDLQSFSFDEAFTAGVDLNGSLGHVLDTLPDVESSPPLYFVLAWFWTELFGLGEVGLRSLSALLGTALVPVVFGAARELAGPRAGLLAAALVAVNPLLFFYSQEARVYALFILLATLSFWAFLVARRAPGRRSLALWALASALALLSHYFALFLVVPEAIWLLVVTRPRLPAVLAVGAVGAVGAALLPLVASQADGRTDWISDSPLVDRTKEVAKKWLTGEYDPTSNALLGLLLLVLGGGIAYGLWRARPQERRGVAVAVTLGAGVPLIALVLDLAGQDYLVAKNVLLALPILAIAAGAALGSSGAGRIGLIAGALACAGFLAITLVSLTDRTLRRPDMRAAAEALGPPDSSEAVVTVYHGSMPLRLYRPGSTELPPGAAPRELNVVLPLTRGDLEGPTRPPTPPAPPGFALAEREEYPTFTLLTYRAPTPTPLDAGTALALAPGTTTFPSVAMLWP
jgi:mannosyltransferase